MTVETEVSAVCVSDLFDRCAGGTKSIVHVMTMPIHRAKRQKNSRPDGLGGHIAGIESKSRPFNKVEIHKNSAVSAKGVGQKKPPRFGEEGGGINWQR
ncbi:MAG: hypothetical protein OJI67_00980, partial [Prosthecobacter sp.]|nr:hypothetical protein [Prosthecobacter sp.]